MLLNKQGASKSSHLVADGGRTLQATNLFAGNEVQLEVPFEVRIPNFAGVSMKQNLEGHRQWVEM